jgi:hypothetical protein
MCADEQAALKLSSSSSSTASASRPEFAQPGAPGRLEPARQAEPHARQRDQQPAVPVREHVGGLGEEARHRGRVGCGSLAVAHRPNEWIPPGDLTTAIDLTEALVRGYTTA